jgi:hypothetical protein
MDKQTRLLKTFALELPDRPPILGGWLALIMSDLKFYIFGYKFINFHVLFFSTFFLFSFQKSPINLSQAFSES